MSHLVIIDFYNSNLSFKDKNHLKMAELKADVGIIGQLTGLYGPYSTVHHKMRKSI